MSAGIINVDVNPGGILDAIFKGIDSLVTSDEEKLSLKNAAAKAAADERLQEWAIAAGLMQGQIDNNKIEAASSSLFVAGWRPFIGWVCGAALAYEFLAYPLLVWAARLWFPGIDVPLVAGDNLFELVLAMLGLAGWRTVEKVKGVAS